MIGQLRGVVRGFTGQRMCLFLLGVLACGAIFVTSCFAAEDPDPTEQLRPFIEKVTAILRDGQEQNAAKCDICQRIIDVARERFDFEEMSKRVLGRHWQPLTSEQRHEFEDVFTRLLQHAYIGKIEEYAGQQVEYVKQRIRGSRAEVQTVLIDQGTTIPVSYIMILNGNQWMVYDVVVEGVSLVRNYKEQFEQIIQADGYEQLVKDIEKKISEIEVEPSPATP